MPKNNERTTVVGCRVLREEAGAIDAWARERGMDRATALRRLIGEATGIQFQPLGPNRPPLTPPRKLYTTPDEDPDPPVFDVEEGS